MGGTNLGSCDGKFQEYLSGVRQPGPAAAPWSSPYESESEITNLARGMTHTSRGYMSAQEVTPASEPHKNGTRDAGMGSHGGVDPCSPK